MITTQEKEVKCQSSRQPRDREEDGQSPLTPCSLDPLCSSEGLSQLSQCPRLSDLLPEDPRPPKGFRAADRKGNHTSAAPFGENNASFSQEPCRRNQHAFGYFTPKLSGEKEYFNSSSADDNLHRFFSATHIHTPFFPLSAICNCEFRCPHVHGRV